MNPSSLRIRDGADLAGSASSPKSKAEVLADAAHEVVESHRVDESWNYTLPDEYQERRRDPWLR